MAVRSARERSVGLTAADTQELIWVEGDGKRELAGSASELSIG